MKYMREEKSNMWVAVVLGIPALFLLFVVYPLALVLYRSVLSEDGSLSFVYFTRFLARKYYQNTLVNSLKVIIIPTLVAAVLGLAMAYMLWSMQIKGGKHLDIPIVISYLSSPLIGAYAWVRLLGQNGFFAKILSSLFHIKLGDIYGSTDIMLIFFLQSFPLVCMYVFDALKNPDNSLGETAEGLDYTVFRRVARITVPLVIPTILAGSLLTPMRAFSDFGTPMLIGEGYKTLPVLIYGQFMGEVSTGSHSTAALYIIIIGITLVLSSFRRYLGSHFTYSMTTLKPMATEKCTGTRNILSHLFVYAVIFIAILPQITIIITSLLATGNETVYTGGFPLENYRNTLSSKNNNTAIFSTYPFGIRTTTAVVVFGILISYLTVRKRSFLTDTLDTVTMLPYVTPGPVLGISFLYAFNSKPLLLSNTTAVIIIPLSIRRIPYTVRSSTAIISQISPSVKEAAISLGCTKAKSFVEITVPMMMSGVLPGAIISWITLISKFSSPIILYTSKTQTLTVTIYAEVIRSNLGNATAHSAILTPTNILSLPMSLKVTGNNNISI